MKTEALKLADELDALHQYVPSEAPKMIRRLVEEMDALNAKESMWQEMIEDLECQVIKYKQGEPVVYWDGKHFASKEKSSLADIPLYTTPQTKPLSDEELDKEVSIKMNQILMDLIDSEDWNKGCTKQHLVNFARAIEERHGIK